MPTNGVPPEGAAIAAHPESAEKSIMTMHAKASAEKPILVPGSNVWRVAHAERASLIIDAADYFSAARAAMLAAEKRIMLIGWDFDARIRLGSPKDGSRAPATVGSFILWLVKHRPDLEVYVLRWNFGAVKSLFRGTTPLTIAKWALHDRIHFRLDSAHPLGASHHQKIVVVDDCLAFCGGIDMTRGRWDTRQHLDDDPGRIGPDRKSYGPWHDANMAIEGPIAAALGELARERWQCAGGEALSAVERKGSCWPDNLKIQFKKIDIGISRTRPKYGDNDEAHEIEALYLDLIAGARRHIYAESQYFASRKIAEAIARRLAEADGPEIVLLNPEKADGWLEQEAMDTARARLFEALKRGDKRGRFRLYHPFTEAGEPIYVHAKIMIVDDEILRVGSSNFNNRSLRLDTECDLTVDATLPGNKAASSTIRDLRNGLLAEHLGVDPAWIARAIRETGSLIRTIERFRGSGRSLRPYKVQDVAGIEKYLADREVLDPEGPDEMFEPIAARGLFRRLRKPHRSTSAKS
jgi:phosphatidylserine/phosphatidylglycerophosphate/cardiolipin synthase-like enzyme